MYENIVVMGKGLLTEAERSELKAQALWGPFLTARGKLLSLGKTKSRAERLAYESVLVAAGVVPVTEVADGLELAPDGLAGKEGSEVDIIRWVARNIDNPETSPSDCPDPFAWTLLRQCRGNPAFVGWFTEKLWAKLIPAKSQLVDDNDDGPMDGTPAVEVLMKIAMLGKKRMGE